MTVQCAYVLQALVLLLQRLQASQLDDEEDDPFDAQISEEEMLEENVPYLTLDEDDDILDILE